MPQYPLFSDSLYNNISQLHQIIMDALSYNELPICNKQVYSDNEKVQFVCKILLFTCFGVLCSKRFIISITRSKPSRKWLEGVEISILFYKEWKIVCSQLSCLSNQFFDSISIKKNIRLIMFINHFFQPIKIIHDRGVGSFLKVGGQDQKLFYWYQKGVGQMSLFNKGQAKK